ncbi:MAG: hypothetical protein Q9226_007864 [Calogaya cf. arnoldii]
MFKRPGLSFQPHAYFAQSHNFAPAATLVDHCHSEILEGSMLKYADQKTETEWVAYKSYNAVLRLNEAAIKDDNIDYPGLLDAKGKHLIPGLLRLHGYGFLTHDSQPFSFAHRSFIDEDDEDDEPYWQDWRRRPYLSFLVPQQDRIPKPIIEEFTLLLLAHPAIVTLVADRDGGRLCRTNINPCHVVSEWRHASSPEELGVEDFGAYKCIPAHFHNWADSCDVDAVTRAGCLDITVASPSWDEDLDLPKLVELIAIEAGMK